MGYFGNVWDGIRTTAQGFKITLGYLKTRPYTVEYPDEVLASQDAPPRHPRIRRGPLHLVPPVREGALSLHHIVERPPTRAAATKGEDVTMTLRHRLFEVPFCALCVRQVRRVHSIMSATAFPVTARR
jgi:hypothetical protein